MPASLYLSQDRPRRILAGNLTEIVKGFPETELSWMISAHMISASILSLIYSISMRNIGPRSQIQILGFLKLLQWSILLFGEVTVNSNSLKLKLSIINIFLYMCIFCFSNIGIFLQEHFLELEYLS